MVSGVDIILFSVVWLRLCVVVMVLVIRLWLVIMFIGIGLDGSLCDIIRYFICWWCIRLVVLCMLSVVGVWMMWVILMFEVCMVMIFVVMDLV